jgi:hypothetical protein
MNQECILPPCPGSGDLKRDIEAVAFEFMSPEYVAHYEAAAQRQAEAELREAHELIMVLPWPLKARAK